MFAINFKEKTIYIFDSLGIVKDSLRQKSFGMKLYAVKLFWTRYCNTMRVHGDEMRHTDWKMEYVFRGNDNTPGHLQEDDYNCGVWCMYFMFCLLEPTRNLKGKHGIEKKLRKVYIDYC